MARSNAANYSNIEHFFLIGHGWTGDGHAVLCGPNAGRFKFAHGVDWIQFKEERQMDRRSFHQEGRRRRRRCRRGVGARRTGNRADQSQDYLAPDVVVPEELLGHDLWRRADALRSMCRKSTDGNFDDPGLRRRRDRAGLQAADAVAAGTVEAVPHGLLLLLGQGPDMGTRLGRAFWAQRTRHERLALPRRRQST